MFFDLNLLNKPGGKYAIIWLAANDKLRIVGRASRKDRELLAKVNISRLCNDLLRNINTRGLPDGAVPTSQRLSLYLSGMLAYGVTVVNLHQIKTALRESFQEKEPIAAKEENTTAIDLLSNGKNPTIDTSIENVREDIEDMMRLPDDPMDFGGQLAIVLRDPGHFIRNVADITLNEVDLPYNEANQADKDDWFGDGSTNEWTNAGEGGLLAPPELAPVPLTPPGREVAIRDQEQVVDVANQEQVVEMANVEQEQAIEMANIGQEQAVDIANRNQEPVFALQPIDPPLRNQRRRSLIIDETIQIPVGALQHQVADFSKIVRPYQTEQENINGMRKEKPNSLLTRPGKKCAGALNQLFRKRAVTRPADDEDASLPNLLDNVVVNNDEPRPANLALQGPVDELPNTEPLADQMDIIEPPVDQVNATGPAVAEMDQSEPQTADGTAAPIVDSVEIRNQADSSSGLTFSASGSSSRVNASESDRSGPGDIPGPRRRSRLETVQEEDNIRNRVSQIERRTTGSRASPDQEPLEGAVLDEEVPESAAQMRPESPTIDIPQEELDRRIDQLTEQGEEITFRKLAPPGETTVEEATHLLFCVLGMVKDRKIDVTQLSCDRLPFNDIFIQRV